MCGKSIMQKGILQHTVNAGDDRKPLSYNIGVWQDADTYFFYNLCGRTHLIGTLCRSARWQYAAQPWYAASRSSGLRSTVPRVMPSASAASDSSAEK